MNAEDLNLLIRRRRSVFQAEYSGATVDDSIIDQMLENANWAPTHKLTEPWRFVVYTGEGLKALAALQADYYKKTTQADGTFREERYTNLLTKPLLSSHIIVIAMRRDERRSLPEIEEAGAVFCAIQNMYLTATACGIGCYLSTGGITYFEDAQEVFGFHADHKLIGFLHIGIPKSPPHDGKRRPLTDKVRWVRGH
jgi:nitroreductase